jgi:hypothetical protein
VANYKLDYLLPLNKDPEGNIVKCTFINITKPMESFYIFNPLLNYYVFVPDYWIFIVAPKNETLYFTSYYDIFDGYYHVPLKVPIKVLKTKTYIPSKKSTGPNTAPIFGLNE